jgi:hypothetical protein
MSDTENTALERVDINADNSIEGAQNDLDPSTKAFFERSMSMMVGQFSRESAIEKNIQPEHISAYLEGMSDSTKRSFRERRENKVFALLLVAVALVFFIFLIDKLKDNPELLQNIIYAVIGLIAGALGGYGVGQKKRSDDD